MSIRNAFVWSFLANLAPLIVVPLVLLVLARLLSPGDFGIVAMVMVVMAFLKLFRDAGMGQIIIQADSEDVSNFVFTVQLVISFVFVLLVFVLAPLVGEYFNTNEIVAPLRVASLELIVAPFLDIPIFLSMRRIDFKAQFVRKAIVPVIAGVLSIILAYGGYGYWSIIVGTLAGSLVAALVLYKWMAWFPRLDLNYRKYGIELSFGFHMLKQAATAWVINSLDRMFLSHYHDSNTVGYYEMASRSSQVPYSVLSAPTNQLMYPVFRKRAREGLEINDLYLRITRYVVLLTLPSSIYLLFHSEDLILLLLGDKWKIIDEIFTYLVIMVMTATFVTLNVEMYKAVGKAEVMTRFMLIRALVSIPVYYYTAMMGAVALAMGRAGLALLFSPVNIVILLRTVGITFSDYSNNLKKPLFITLFLAVVFFMVDAIVEYHDATFVINSVVMLFLYIYLFFTEYRHLLPGIKR